MLAWIDLETTGLDIDRAQVLEVACVVTDNDLKVLGTFSRVVLPDKEPLFEAGAYEMHRANGLLAALYPEGNAIEQVDAELAAFLQHMQSVPSEVAAGGFALTSKPPMAGSTITFDRVVLRKFFPLSYPWFHYRSVDVSSLKELCKRWRLDVYRAYVDGPGKRKTHRALDDIHQSIEELRIYKQALFASVKL